MLFRRLSHRNAMPIDEAVRYASLWRRGLAYSFDIGILYIVFVAIQFALIPIRSALPDGWMRSGLLLEGYTLLTISLPVWLYFIISERSSHQATIGKRLLGLRVVSQSQTRITLGQAVARTAVKLLPWELAHITVNLPAPMLIDPQTGAFDWERGSFRFGFIMVYALIGLYLAAVVVTRRKQSIHDLVAGTVVMRASRELHHLP